MKTKVSSVKIKDVGGIKELELYFNPRLNLICGMNGVGKSTILECIVHAFSHASTGKLKRNSRSKSGEWVVNIDGRDISNVLNNFRPLDSEYQPYNLLISSKMVIYIREQRQIDYQPVDFIKRDEERDVSTYSHHMIRGVTPETIKTWFINRLVFEKQDRFSETELYNLGAAKRCFTLLDPSVNYSHILHDSLDIIINTGRGEVYLEYLSSGFKSCLYIILGIIKEIEFNFKEPKMKVSDFEGVILIDEADAHLHPHWQGVFLKVLKEIFNSAQIILTTHSPHMIQEADLDEIIALGFNEFGEVQKLDLETSEYGFKGWTIEEILEDVMGLKEARSNEYIRVRKRFEEALEREDEALAIANYEILKKMLHPRSPMKKIYELQLGTIGD